MLSQSRGMSITISFVLLIVQMMALTSSAEDDPVGEKLTTARLAYQREIEQLRTELLESLQEKEEAARKAGNVKQVQLIKDETEAFDLSDTLPKIVPTDRYTRGIKKAKTELKSALQTAIKEYLIAKQDDAAEALQPEVEEIQAALADNTKRPKPGKKKVSQAPTVVSQWIQQVEHKGFSKRGEFKLYSNGRINDPNSRNTWSIQGRILTLRWQDPKAPGGAWVDIVTLSADGSVYEGKNQEGATIKGVRAAP